MSSSEDLSESWDALEDFSSRCSSFENLSIASCQLDLTGTTTEQKTSSSSTSRARTTPQEYKHFMEHRIHDVIKAVQQRRCRRAALEQDLVQFDFSKDPGMSERLREMLRRKETNHLRLERSKLCKEDFDFVARIGTDVSLVRSRVKPRGRLCVMKRMGKRRVWGEEGKVARVVAERDLLADADNDWMVKLYYSFQDRNSLYFVMEYLPGGDLRTLLSRKGTFDEELARFYAIELIFAVSCVHSSGVVHRDIRPDNVLVDAEGHIKLAGFGRCAGFGWNHHTGRYEFYPTADNAAGRNDGSPAHPEGEEAPEQRQRLPSCHCASTNYAARDMTPAEADAFDDLARRDWRSVGVVLFEMLFGPDLTRSKVTGCLETLEFPPTPSISPEAEDLLRSLLLTKADYMLDSEALKGHPFFQGVNFNRSYRRCRAPYIPTLSHLLDTSNFDTKEEEEEIQDENDNDGSGNYPALFEFTFRRFFQ